MSHPTKDHPPLIRPIPPKDIPLIRPDFKCTEIVIYYEIAPSRYTTTLMYKATLSFQKEWLYKRGTTVHCVASCLYNKLQAATLYKDDELESHLLLNTCTLLYIALQ